MKGLKIRNKTIAEQASAFRSRYPHFGTNFSSKSGLKVTGAIRPSSRSIDYHFVLRYNLQEKPKMKIVSPVLRKNEKDENPEHLYPGGYLCLYQPKYHEFSRTDLLTDTIIPWTTLWLYHYEVWHMTGEWLGGGEHPNPSITNK